ncbi:hypothetical protein AVEN_156361-1 [Araneus ventricosus]|uniref:ATP-dependent DNA helicase n=1 Tax=Araneus ventricosus TaxID=182803 RepID=A0A4Y2W2D2_ARAVE|nr:hypothetical protein AVEN_156361-1 [Araneus ventricosus]
MPKRRKGANLSRRTTNSTVMRDIRARRSGEQIQQNNTDVRASMAQLRESLSEEARDERNQQRQLERRETRRFIVNRRRGIDQQRQQLLRAFTSDSFLRLAFQYEPDVEYYAHSKVVIGSLDKECPHCHALKFKNEPVGMCCSSGKVQLTEI